MKSGASGFFNPGGHQAAGLAYARPQYDAELGPNAATAAAVAAATAAAAEEEAMRNSAYSYAARLRSASQDMYVPQVSPVGQYEHMGYAQYPAGFEYAQYGDRYSPNFYNYAAASSVTAGATAGYPLAAPTSMGYYSSSSEAGYPGRSAMAGYVTEFGAAAGYPRWA